MTRRVVAAIAILLAAVLLAPGAGAQDSVQDGGVELPDPHIIPRPNSGQEPDDAGDRGGALQVLVLVAVVAAIGGGIALVVRESRRARSSE